MSVRGELRGGWHGRGRGEKSQPGAVGSSRSHHGGLGLAPAGGFPIAAGTTRPQIVTPTARLGTSSFCREKPDAAAAGGCGEERSPGSSTSRGAEGLGPCPRPHLPSRQGLGASLSDRLPLLTRGHPDSAEPAAPARIRDRHSFCPLSRIRRCQASSGDVLGP